MPSSPPPPGRAHARPSQPAVDLRLAKRLDVDALARSLELPAGERDEAAADFLAAAQLQRDEPAADGLGAAPLPPRQASGAASAASAASSPASSPLTAQRRRSPVGLLVRAGP